MCILYVFFPLILKEDMEAKEPKITKLTSALKNNSFPVVSCLN